jgi:preprotein translocase subunit Sss1
VKNDNKHYGWLGLAGVAGLIVLGFIGWAITSLYEIISALVFLLSR